MQVIHPSCHVRHLTLWKAVYLSDTAPVKSAEDLHNVADSDEHLTDDSETTLLPKTRSCDDLLLATEHSSPTMTRRLSDPNIPCDLNDLLLNSTDTSGDSGSDYANKAESETETKASSVAVVGDKDSEHTVQIDEDTSSATFCFTKAKSKSVETLKASESDEKVIGTDGEVCASEDEQNEADRDVTGNDCTITNGCDTEKKAYLVNGHCEVGNLKGTPNLINGSTDTLTEEGEKTRVSSTSSQKDSINTTEETAVEASAISNGHGESELEVLRKKLSNTSLLTMGKWSHMSTSTTEISDSHVRPGNNGKLTHGVCRLDDFLTLQKVSSTLQGMPNSHSLGRRAKETISSGFYNGIDSEHSSRDSHATPGSVSPPSPGESKVRMTIIKTRNP